MEESVVSATLEFILDEVEAIDLQSSSSSSDSDEDPLPTPKKKTRAPRGPKKSKEERMEERRKRAREKTGKRREIRAILDDSQLSLDTLSAQAREKERLERLRRVLPARSPALSTGSDDIVVLSDEEAVKEEATPSYLDGDFTDDRENVADSEGRLLVNPAHEPDDPDIFVPHHLASKIKPHQLGGVRFMYNNSVEDLSRMQSSEGLGCILAHSMGLGKTLQVITFMDILFRYTSTKRVIIIVPVNTLQNWIQEFEKWVPEEGNEEAGIPPRQFRVCVVNETAKTTDQRARVIRDWYEGGGVLVMGYEMFRRMVHKDLQTPAAKFREAEERKLKKRRLDMESAILAGRSIPEEVVDIEEEEIQCSLSQLMKEALLDPGPDVIVCDEGHRIKNLKTGTARILNSIRTK